MEARSPFARRVPLGSARGTSSFEASARRLFEALEPLLTRLRLHRQEYLILALLWEGDGLRPAHLAARLGVAEAMADGWLDAMELRGLVERDRATEPEDVWLTARGRALQALAPRVPSALLCHVLGWLDHEELAPARAPRQAATSPVGESGECPDGAIA